MWRHEYRIVIEPDRLQPPVWPGPALLRPPTAEDADELAELLVDAYRGTVDWNDESITDARAEISRYLSGRPLLGQSRVALVDRAIVSAVLLSESQAHPVINHVMTAADHKRRGWGTALLFEAIRALAEEGWTEVRAFVTAGNVPSERLFAGAGFMPTAP